MAFEGSIWTLGYVFARSHEFAVAIGSPMIEVIWVRPEMEIFLQHGAKAEPVKLSFEALDVFCWKTSRRDNATPQYLT